MQSVPVCGLSGLKWKKESDLNQIRLQSERSLRVLNRFYTSLQCSHSSHCLSLALLAFTFNPGLFHYKILQFINHGVLILPVIPVFLMGRGGNPESSNRRKRARNKNRKSRWFEFAGFDEVSEEKLKHGTHLKLPF